jgi:hypothetical protein
VADARGVSHTAALATTVIANVPKNAIHHTRSRRRCSPRVRHPSLECPSLVTTSSMIKVASTGVMDHTEIQTNRFKPNPNASIHNAAATASTSTITVKMQAF